MRHHKLLFLLIAGILTSCSLLDRRDYTYQMDEYYHEQPMFMAGRDFPVSAGDTGRDHYRTDKEIARRTPASLGQKREYLYERSLERELRHLEARLTESEYDEFKQIRGQIGSISEQIYCLRLNEYEKAEYLAMRKIRPLRARNSRGRYGHGPQRVAFHPPYQANNPKGLRASTGLNDVVLGMTMDDVVGVWGAPEKRDIAGNPKLKNERWAFRRNGKVKFIYFESGKVRGWSESQYY